MDPRMMSFLKGKSIDLDHPIDARVCLCDATVTELKLPAVAAQALLNEMGRCISGPPIESLWAHGHQKLLEATGRTIDPVWDEYQDLKRLLAAEESA